MPPVKLSDKACRTAKPKEKAYKLFDGGGLYLEVTAKGSKLWRLKYRYLQKEKRLALGSYPLISLAEARELREQNKKLLTQGIDPSAHKKEQKHLQRLNSDNTFEKLACEWYDTQKPAWSESHARYTWRRLDQNILPEIGHLPIKEVKPLQVLDALKKVEARGANEMASRCRSLCDQVFRYAIISGRCEYNPAADLQGALQPYKKTHYAAITSEQLPEFIRTLKSNRARLYPHTLLAVEMLMLTFVRTSELIKATWDEFDLEAKVWRIPAERMKMDREHVVPLSARVIDILRELKELCPTSRYIFPSQIQLSKHMSNNTILKALERMGYKGVMTGHGFRALAMSTIKEKLGYAHEVVDLQLAHQKKSNVDRAYDRATFIEERTKMMQDWDDYIKSLGNK